MFRRCLGLIAMALSAYSIYAPILALAAYISRGGAANSLISEPAFLLPISAGLAAFFGGTLAALNWRGGAWGLGIACLLLLVIVGAMVAMGADSSLWGTKAIYLAGFVALFVGLLRVKRT